MSRTENDIYIVLYYIINDDNINVLLYLTDTETTDGIITTLGKFSEYKHFRFDYCIF